jgi:hypothetical protein
MFHIAQRLMGSWRVLLTTVVLVVSGCGGDKPPASCGAEGQACCTGSACNTGQSCQSGTCQASPVACGDLAHACCAGDTCHDPLVCRSGTCQAASPPSGTGGGACQYNNSCATPSLCVYPSPFAPSQDLLQCYLSQCACPNNYVLCPGLPGTKGICCPGISGDASICKGADGYCHMSTGSTGKCAPLPSGEACVSDSDCADGLSCAGSNPAERGTHGTCQPLCTPHCDGHQCGDNGCGDVCGSCAVGSTCTSSGMCCARRCNSKQCGPDGCGGSCGTCTYGTCSATGQCVCTPDCSKATCANDNDGCGHKCGKACAAGQMCNGSPPACVVCSPNGTACGVGTSTVCCNGCYTWYDRTFGTPTNKCGLQPAGLPTGSACTADNDCISGICWSSTGSNKKCVCRTTGSQCYRYLADQCCAGLSCSSYSQGLTFCQ